MKFIFFANTDWYLYNFRLSTALQLKLRGAEVVMLSPPGNYGARFAEHGIRWITLAMNRASLNPLREAQALRQLVRILQAERPDLLHNFTVKCAVYGALAARVAKVPAVVNAVAGMGYVFTSNRLKARALRPVVKLLMRNTLGVGHSRLIVQNPDDAEAFTASRLVSPLKIRLIRSSGVDTFRFCPPPQHVPRPRTLRVVLAARLLWEKGIREFVEAANLLKQQGRDIQFFLAGTPDSGNPSAVGLSDVQDWQDRGLVTWLGHVDDMPALLHSADVMVLPSYYREGVPKCLIEGAACGLALISTNLPGCREVIERHGVDGLHVEPRNANALAELLARLDDDRELLRQLGDCARQKALAQFDERIVIESTIAVYGELLREPLRAVERAV